MPALSLLIWGAGRIGRGFVADLFANAYHIVLIDRAEALVESLRQRGQYTVVRATGADSRQDRLISGFDVLSTAQTGAVANAVAASALIVVAVFPQNFARVAGQMAPGLLRRRARRPGLPLDIILCANLAHAGPAFRVPLIAALPPGARSWADSNVGVVESLVIRMVAEPPAEELARDPLLVWTNGYAEFPVDRRAFRGELPAVAALRPVDGMRAEEMRKLYTYNTFHAALAYLGALRGHVRVIDCIADPTVRGPAEGATREAAAALQAEYGFADDVMARWIDGVLAQTSNPTLGDTVARFGGDPRRKLRRADRLIGPLLLAGKHEIEAPHLTRAVAAALRYDSPDDAGAAQVQAQIAASGLPGAIRVLCELTDEEEGQVAAIVRAYRLLCLDPGWAGCAEKAYRLGFEYERVYHGCGQCVLAAVQDAAGLFDETAFNGTFEAATGLAGGIGLCGDGTCSAFTGGALALGLYSPRRRDHFYGDRENKYRAYDLIQRLRERFLDHYGGIRCHDVQRHELGRAFDLRDPAERQAFEAAGAHDDKCTGVVGRAAQWVVEIVGGEQFAAQRRSGAV